ncbi:type II secretion system F family protein [Spiribacter halobius]|uniref:Type II secretion system protein F n=1 Tax=Sediminicurvatus halobius TaxID=2182432 RepID=A0A2U2N7Q2_9GAMM|nr:type II secretion system F family protein [Spiribacter halobius]PWG65160.1 type II secretion system protein F [Spiribacter halobius]UEX78889.1 type II secretion system F family protein [Spiribacter halobius]
MAEKAAKLASFTWEGVDRQGRKVKGDSQAENPSRLRLTLRQQGIAAQKIRRKSSLSQLLEGKRSKKITPGDIAVFTRQLSTMLNSGVPLVQAFDIIGRGHENPSMRKLVMAIKDDVESGTALSEALGKHPLYFDELVCNLVNAGEQAGVLDTLLDKIATYKEKTESIKKKIRKALFYPTAVLVVAFAVTAILLIFVVPQFESLFRGFGADLPAFTRMVLNLSDFFRAWWWAIFGGLIGGVVLFLEAKKRSRRFAHFLDRVALRIPVVGSILRKAAIARFARTLSTMFAAGVPLVEALGSVAGATGNAVYGEAVRGMQDEVATGQQLQWSVEQTKLFPHMVVQMIAIGEEAGSLDAMLAKVADFYEEEVDNAIDSLSSLLEPLIMAVLGVLVGGLVIAMYLPIFKLGSVV